MHRQSFYFVLALCLVPFVQVRAAVPKVTSFQGLLMTSGGAPVPDGSYDLTFKLYSVPSGPDAALWTETHLDVTVANGSFFVLLGDAGTPLDLAFDQQYWLGITMGIDPEFTPRVKIASAPTALTARSVEDGAVTTAKLADGAVTTVKLSDLLVTTAKIFDGAVTTAKLADLAVSTGKLTEGCATAAKIADGAVTSSKIADGAVSKGKLGPDAINGSVVADGSIATSELADDAVTTAKLAEGAVTASKLAPASVTEPAVATGAVTELKLATGAVTSAKIADLTITSGDLAVDAVTEPRLAANAVTSAKIADLTITSSDLAVEAVTEAKVATGAVTSAKIADLTITSGDLAVDAVTEPKLAAGAVTSGKIAAGAVTSGKIAGSAVTSAELADEPGVVYDQDASSTTIGTTVVVASVTVTTPSAGYVWVHIDGYFLTATHSTETVVRASISETTSASTDDHSGCLVAIRATWPSGAYAFPFAKSRAFSKAAGTYTFNLVADVLTGADPVEVRGGNLQAIFLPTSYGTVAGAIAKSLD
jgi:hypothetical protein